MYRPISPSTYLSIYLSLSVCLSAVCLSVYLATCLSASLKTKLFCETSSGFELDNIKNAAILRDFLNVWTWQRQKRSNSARLPSKMASWVQSWRPRTNAFCDIPVHLSKLLRLPRKSDARSYEVLHLSRKIISANLKIWCSKMQTLSGNQRRDLLTAASFQILFKCPTPAIVFGNATKPSCFAHFWQGPQSLAPATRKSKSGPNPWCF